MSELSHSSQSKNCHDHKWAAQNHWKILARSLIKNSCDRQTQREQNSSIQVFSTFHLIEFKQFEKIAFSPAVDLFQCRATIEEETYTVLIQIPRRRITLAQIAGFNNTGNICVWPTEEVMAFYALSNLKMFHGKRILELGGGMTCLTGLMVAKYSTATKIHLTDGNILSIQNVKVIINTNALDEEKVSCSILEWSEAWRALKNEERYDIILSADCLFFDEARKDLVRAMWMLLRNDGVSIVMAPLRGDTFDKFVTLAEARGFHCIIQQNYNGHIWRRHLAFKEMQEYEENNHYPLLLQLTKKNINKLIHQ